MGQLLSLLRRFFFPELLAESKVTIYAQLEPVLQQFDPAAVDKVEKVIHKFVDRDDDSDEMPVDANFLLQVPDDVERAFELMLLKTKVRLGPVPKKQKDGSFKCKRKMSNSQLRSIGFTAIKHFNIASDLISKSHYRSALRELDQVPESSFELAHDVAFNKSHCWEKLKCYNNALDEAIRCILIDKQSSSGYFKTGRLLNRKRCFFEAEYCFRKAELFSSPGDMLTVYAIRKAVKVNMRSAITQSGFESEVAELACHLYRRLHEAAVGLQSGEAFRQKHIWSCSYVTEPAHEKDEEKHLTAYDKRLKEIVSQ